MYQLAKVVLLTNKVDIKWLSMLIAESVNFGSFLVREKVSMCERATLFLN